MRYSTKTRLYTAWLIAASALFGGLTLYATTEGTFGGYMVGAACLLVVIEMAWLAGYNHGLNVE